jgi:hypothetical protein
MIVLGNKMVEGQVEEASTQKGEGHIEEGVCHDGLTLPSCPAFKGN